MAMQPADIADAALCALLTDAKAALDADENRRCVELCGEAYLICLKQFPPIARGLERALANEEIKAGIAAGVVRVAPFMWPRFVAKLDMDGAAPRIVFDRKSVSFVEAVQYYEFTLNLIVEAEHGAFTQRFPGQGS